MTTVTWLSPGDPSQRTGGYLYNARMIEGLRDLGIRVDVVRLDGDWTRPDTVHDCSDEIGQIRPGTVVVADGLLWPGLAEASRERLCGTCTVWVVVHSLADKECSNREVAAHVAQREASALRHAHGWFATSHRTARAVVDRLNGAQGAVIVPGTDRPGATAPGEPTAFLSVGHLIPRKGHEAVLEALARVPAGRDWTLRIVGSPHRDPDHAEHLRQRAMALGLADRVTFVGECGAEALEAEYARAGVLVHAPHFEAYGMVISEALTRGLPVIATPSGATDDIAPEAPAVLLTNHDALHDTLVRWLEEPRLRERALQSAPSLLFPSWSEQVVALRSLLGLVEHRFSTDWLQLREPFDHAARSTTLVEQFGAQLPMPSRRLLELATGLGSGARFVDQRLEGATHWSLIDHDPRLLEALCDQMARHRPGLRFDTIRHDLEDIDGLPTQVDGVTMQALLDLVSESWLNRFADWLASHRLPLLAATSVDGRVSWSIDDPADRIVMAAFRAHQTWDRGFGASPGVEAVPRLESLLRARNFMTEVCEADWVIPATAVEMMRAMVTGVAEAAAEASRAVGSTPAEVAGWRERRLGQVGTLGMRVGHLDLLALPQS